MLVSRIHSRLSAQPPLRRLYWCVIYDTSTGEAVEETDPQELPIIAKFEGEALIVELEETILQAREVA